MGSTLPASQQEEYQLLHEAFMQYSECLNSPASELSKARLNQLTEQLQARGVHGPAALQLLHKHAPQIAWQGMSPDVFSLFYRFVYFLCREQGKRNMQAKTAVAAWRALLRGRFRLLDRWCDYVARHHRSPVVLEDTWRQVLDFARTVHEDLGNYDAASAWPVLLDEFVEHLRSTSAGRRSVEPVDVMLDPAGADHGLAAVSPHSGSKRRLPDILEVLDQLQQLPLGSNGQQQQQHQHGGGLAWRGSSSAAQQALSSAPGGAGARTAAKRYRAAAPQGAAAAAAAPALAADSSGGGGGGSSGGGSSGGGMGDGTRDEEAAGDAPMSSPVSRTAGGLHPMSKTLGQPQQFGRSPWGTLGQQQQFAAINNNNSAFGGCGAAGGAREDGAVGPALFPRAARVACGGAADEGSMQQHQQQQQQQGQPAPCGPFGGITLPPCCPGLGCGSPGQPAPQQAHACGPGGVVGGSSFPPHAHRHSSNVNAMMQVTVTEALGFN